MSYCNVFKRYELKYLLSLEQYGRLKIIMREHMCADKYGESDILNIYYDTPDFLLIRRSLEKPFYKEKLRVRSYGVPAEDGKVFVEIKKKFDSVVYKRRVVAAQNGYQQLLSGGGADTQIGKEINYLVNFYREISPKMVISYRREAFFAREGGELRVTFDDNILWRDYDLSLSKGIYGLPVLPEGYVLMEVKTASSFPLWLTEFLSRNAIYKRSFSKYGNAYVQFLQSTKKGGEKVA